MKEEQPTRSPIDEEIARLRAELEQVRRERDAALDNADFWGRELNNFRQNAAHRAEQLAKEKVEAAEQSRERMRKALEKIANLDFKKRPDGGDEFYSHSQFFNAVDIARKALEGER